eukprot:s2333_g3.t1
MTEAEDDRFLTMLALTLYAAVARHQGVALQIRGLAEMLLAADRKQFEEPNQKTAGLLLTDEVQKCRPTDICTDFTGTPNDEQEFTLTGVLRVDSKAEIAATPERDYRLWRGAYSPHAPWKGQQQPKKPVFPTYDGIDLTKEENKTGQSGTVRSNTSGYLTQDLQSAVNATRKAEVKVQKLHSSYTTTQEQWIQYEKWAKESFVREKRRFRANLERIEREALEAEDHQHQCRLRVREIVMGTGTGSSGVRSLPREEPDVEQLFQSWVDEEDDDGVMRRALGTAATGLATKTPQRVRTNVPMSPPQTVPNSDRAAEDPYLAMGNPDVTPNSVGTGGPLGTAGPPGLSPQVPCHPGQRDRDLLRVPTHEAPPRTGIKDASKRRAVTPRQHVSLEEKLQERRQRELAKGSAMRPFRTGQVPEAPGFRTSTQKGSDRVLGNKEDGRCGVLIGRTPHAKLLEVKTPTTVLLTCHILD